MNNAYKTETYKKFAEKFDKTNALKIVYAAEEHEPLTYASCRGNDPFKWALLMCIAFQCIEVPEYADYHGFTFDLVEVRKWIKENVDFSDYDGDLGPLSLAAGVFAQYGIPSPLDALVDR